VKTHGLAVMLETLESCPDLNGILCLRYFCLTMRSNIRLCALSNEPEKSDNSMFSAGVETECKRCASQLSRDHPEMSLRDSQSSYTGIALKELKIKYALICLKTAYL
jgi:hypothetical protein